MLELNHPVAHAAAVENAAASTEFADIETISTPTEYGGELFIHLVSLCLICGTTLASKGTSKLPNMGKALLSAKLLRLALVVLEQSVEFNHSICEWRAAAAVSAAAAPVDAYSRVSFDDWGAGGQRIGRHNVPPVSRGSLMIPFVDFFTHFSSEILESESSRVKYIADKLDALASLSTTIANDTLIKWLRERVSSMSSSRKSRTATVSYNLKM
jgi:hypothetical protein